MTNTKLKILLAEDDANLGMLLKEYLEQEGYEILLAKDGEMALNFFNKAKFDLCLLDVMMPKMDGFSLAKEIRLSNKEIPFIFLTAKSLKEDKTKGYGLGADDYISKPFDEEELLWKIKAIFRRMPENKIEATAVFQIGQYTFNFLNQSLTINGSVKRITEKECELLQYLCMNPNKILKREDILKDLWGENDYFLGRSLDVFITKIRKYLKEDSSIEIENVFGVGFIFNLH
jgi:two-component system OmpR family response regulator